MKIVAAAALVAAAASAQTPGASEFRIALPSHKGQLSWTAADFNITQTSAKPNGHEIGIRAATASRQTTFLAFLFVVAPAPATSAACRDGALTVEKKLTRSLRGLEVSEFVRPEQPRIALASYTTRDGGAVWHVVRGFIAAEDLCGDLAFFSTKPITADDPQLRAAFSTWRLDSTHDPTARDAFVYAQALYQAQMFGAAAPIFEIALSRIADNSIPSVSVKTATRVLTDQAGMSYGMAGQVAKAREIFERAIVHDPEYPMYYYNLACADAKEKKLADARAHLQAAFERRANMISGESFPDPTKDDSFLPYRNNKEFWRFLQQLQAIR